MAHGVALTTESGTMQFFSEQEMRQYLSGGGSTGSLIQIAEQAYTNITSGSAQAQSIIKEEVDAIINTVDQVAATYPSVFVDIPQDEDWGTPEEPDEPEPFGPAYYPPDGDFAGGGSPNIFAQPQYTGQQPTLGAGAGAWFSKLSGWDALQGGAQNVAVQVDYWKEVIRYGQYDGGIESSQPRSYGGPGGNWYESVMEQGDNQIAKQLGFQYRGR